MRTFLTRTAILALSALLVMGTVSAPAAAAPSSEEKQVADRLVELTNEFRAENFLKPLSRNAAVRAVLQWQAEEWGKTGGVVWDVPSHLAYPSDIDLDSMQRRGVVGSGLMGYAVEAMFDRFASSPAGKTGMLDPQKTHVEFGVHRSGGSTHVMMSIVELTNSPAPGKYAPSPFIDVNPTNTKFYNQIAWAGNNKISSGWKTPRGAEFRPKANMQRDAMAAFLYRQYGKADRVDMSVLNRVKDVNAKTPHAKAIAWMYQQRITTGYADGKFHPQRSVNRDSLAAFLFRVNVMEGAKSTRNVSTSAAVKKFSDVNSSSKFLREIAWMTNERITTGYANGTYRPSEPVSREAMITFIYRVDH